ncbi:hypothetical protein, partial [Metapseudomonas otitidis]|uniref:hypothetical protein n=1 Tax=Metapseudomonas otitidis TaxID=319939 RepID=UPI002447D48A
MSRGCMHRGSVPECCNNCTNLDWNDDYDSGSDVAWCRLALIFPTKKQSCAMRNKDRKKVKS